MSSTRKQLRTLRGKTSMNMITKLIKTISQHEITLPGHSSVVQMSLVTAQMLTLKHLLKHHTTVK